MRTPPDAAIPRAVYANEFIAYPPLWDDLVCSVAAAGGVANLTTEAIGTTGFEVGFCRHDQDDTLFLAWQLPHGWARATAIRPHVHILPAADPVADQVIRFAGAYALAAHDSALATSGWSTFTALHTVSPGAGGKPTIVNLFELTPTDPAARESDILLVKLSRTGTHNDDTYTTSKSYGTAQANVGILSIDAHVRLDKLGTESYVPGA